MLHALNPEEDHRAEVVTITPETAEAWLGKNTRNRTLKTRKIEQYARDIQAGAWRLTGEAIKFGIDGRLLDGQNRLHAVVLAQAPIRSWVVWGIEPEAQDVMDSGVARTAGDALSMNGVKNAKNVAAAARIAMAVERGQSPTVARFSHSELQKWVMDHLEITEAHDVLGRDGRMIPLPSAVRLYCAYRLMLVDRDDAVRFFEQLGSGVGVTAGSPVLALRRRLTGGSYGAVRRISVTEQLTSVFRAWNAFREGRDLARVLGRDRLDKGIPVPI